MEENCKEKIISEDYWDFIIPLYRDEELKEVNPENACIQEMDFGYKSVSVDRRILLPLSFREYWYSTIPKMLYTSGYATVRCGRELLHCRTIRHFS